MADIVSPSKRSAMMASIRSKNTKPELIVRSLLHRLGYRFRLHGKNLPGRPDIVMAKWQTAIFVNGCYWHGHGGCELFRLPKTRTEFWAQKINGNRSRDKQNYCSLTCAGWKAIVIWECAVSKKRRLQTEELSRLLIEAIQSVHPFHEITGNQIPD
jgi:DNA mismatch endonuclease, patch repair protein